MLQIGPKTDLPPGVLAVPFRRLLLGWIVLGGSGGGLVWLLLLPRVQHIWANSSFFQRYEYWLYFGGFLLCCLGLILGGVYLSSCCSWIRDHLLQFWGQGVVGGNGIRSVVSGMTTSGAPAFFPGRLPLIFMKSSFLWNMARLNFPRSHSGLSVPTGTVRRLLRRWRKCFFSA